MQVPTSKEWEEFLTWVNDEHRKGWFENIKKITLQYQWSKNGRELREEILKNLWYLLENREKEDN